MIEYLRTEDVPLDQLIPYPGNARRGDMDGIAQSIETNGQYRSMIVREGIGGDRVVLAGNHTRGALLQLGRATGRCEIIACDDATAARINLVDNRAADNGTYDDAALAGLLQGLDDLTGTGYAQDDLDDLLKSLEESVPDPSPAKDVPDPQPKTDDGTAELILVMSAAERQEAARLISVIRERDGDDLTSGQVVVYALRVHAADPDDEEDDD